MNMIIQKLMSFLMLHLVRELFLIVLGEYNDNSIIFFKVSIISFYSNDYIFKISSMLS